MKVSKTLHQLGGGGNSTAENGQDKMQQPAIDNNTDRSEQI